MAYYIKQSLYQTQIQAAEHPIDGYMELPEDLVTEALNLLQANTQFNFDGYEIEVAPGTPPNSFYVYDFTRKLWADPRSEQQKYDAQVVEVGNTRGLLLVQSDWTQLPDVPLETKTQWATYRQALRDITDQPGYPFNIVWPTPPQ
jgi:hypothetical protein